MTLIEALRTTLRRLHYSPRTEEAYVHWAREFIRFHTRRHPREMGAAEVTAFLNDLAVCRHTSASTQNQALCALVFLYRKVLDLPMPALDGLERARRPEHLPTVLARRDVLALLDQLEPPLRLVGEILYGAGLRLLEALALRVKDVDLERHQITVRRGKGEHDRAALLPARAREGLRAQLDAVGRRHRADLAAGRGEVDLPHALRTKMPGAATSLAWQYLFPASRTCVDPDSGRRILHHLHETVVQKAVRNAAAAAGIDRRATCRGCNEFCAPHFQRDNGAWSIMAHGFRAGLIDELVAGAKTKEAIFGPEGVLKQVTGAIVERVLRAELDAHLTQEREAAEVRGNRRNGSSKKTLQTEQGPVPLEVPRDRAGTFEPQIVPKHATRVPGLDDKILSLYARGLSTRDIQDELSTLYGAEVSPMLISRVTDAVHEEITAWRNRPLDALFTVVWLDALMVKMRDDHVVKARAVYVAVGLTREGTKQVLGMWVETNEGAKFWMRVLSELQQRGVKDILIACCDGLKGFPAAIEAVFPQAVVQTCVVHQVRYSLSFVGWEERKAIAGDLRAIYTAPSEDAARAELDAFESKHGARYPMIVRSWRANWDRITPFLAFPAEIRRLVYTTNAIESLNYQFRKVIKTKGHFPNEDSALKLLYLALRNAERAWKAPPHFWRRANLQLIAYFGEERMLAK